MNIDKSKIFFIQSHDWGGQIFLNTVDNGSFEGVTCNLNDKEIYLSADISGFWAANPADMYFTLLPTPKLGTYYLVKCIFLGFSPNPTDDNPKITEDPKLSKPSDMSLTLLNPELLLPILKPTMMEPSIPPNPIPVDASAFERENYNNLLEMYNQNLANYNRQMVEYNSDLNRYTNAKLLYNAEVKRLHQEYLEKLANYNPIDQPVFKVSHVISKKSDKLISEEYLRNNQYTTTWSIIDIPNITKAADVFLLRMNKANDQDDGKYLSLVWPIPNNTNQKVALSLTDKINTRAQLWNLIGIKWSL